MNRLSLSKAPAAATTHRARVARHRNHLVCRSTDTDEAATSTAPSSSSSSSTAASPPEEARLKSTLADLDALLGIQEEPEPSDAKV
jgi:hypothetical protein